MKRKFKVLIGFYAFLDKPPYQKGEILDICDIENDYCLINNEISIHKSWINNWIGVEVIKEIK